MGDYECFTAFSQNPKFEDYVEHPSRAMLIERTGVEPIRKSIERMMVAGMNLYDTDRTNYIIENPDTVEGQDMPFMNKWADSKDVKMRMRELMRRLRNKTKSERSPSAEAVENNYEGDSEEGETPPQDPAAVAESE